jgi:hypothetical protein
LIGLTFTLGFLAADSDFLILYAVLGFVVTAGWTVHVTEWAGQITTFSRNAKTEVVRKKAELVVAFSMATLFWTLTVFSLGTATLAQDIWLSDFVLMLEGSVFVLWWVFFGVYRFAADFAGRWARNCMARGWFRLMSQVVKLESPYWFDIGRSDAFLSVSSKLDGISLEFLRRCDIHFVCQ